jgi:hypothetical protein
MPTECNPSLFDFARVEGRAVIAGFHGGAMTSDAGGLLLGATGRVLGLTRRLAACFKDSRDPAYVEHAVERLVMQRVSAIALGYEDLNDHDQLRHDPVMAVLAGKLAATRSDCAPLAARADIAAWRQRLLPRGADGVGRGEPRGLCLRPGPQGAAGRRDRSRTGRRPRRSRTGWQTGARFKDFRWSTLNSWSRTRRVIGKAEWTQGAANPRVIVTSLKSDEIDGRRLYETIYRARGEMENRIKECQLDLFADRTSTATMAANQFRLWFSGFASVLLCGLRRIGLAHTQFAQATCGTIRLKLLKIGALIRISVRRITVAMASACPCQHEFALARACLRRAGA